MRISMRILGAVIMMASACGQPGEGSEGEDLTGADGGTSMQCSSPLPCPAPSDATKQTICGQLFDLETSAKLAEGSVGAPCTATTASGPCSLAIDAFDALAYAANPATAAPLARGDVEIDTCGRYRITDISVTGIGPFVALAIDDAAGPGASGTTVAVSIATPKSAGSASDNIEAWIVRESTTTQWTTSGGPPLSGGVFVPLFRAHDLGTPNSDPFAPQAGVTVTKAGNPIEQYYFDAASVDRTVIDAEAGTTGANGTALITNAAAQDGVVYGGTGGLSDPARCRWQPHVGMSLPGIVFVEIFRPLDVIGQQCPM